MRGEGGSTWREGRGVDAGERESTLRGGGVSTARGGGREQYANKPLVRKKKKNATHRQVERRSKEQIADTGAGGGVH
jgi:hypothetical protein